MHLGLTVIHDPCCLFQKLEQASSCCRIYRHRLEACATTRGRSACTACCSGLTADVVFKRLAKARPGVELNLSWKSNHLRLASFNEEIDYLVSAL